MSRRWVQAELKPSGNTRGIVWILLVASALGLLLWLALSDGPGARGRPETLAPFPDTPTAPVGLLTLTDSAQQPLVPAGATAGADSGVNDARATPTTRPTGSGPTGAVVGRTVDDTGRGLAGVVVRLLRQVRVGLEQRPGALVAELRSDASGHFAFPTAPVRHAHMVDARHANASATPITDVQAQPGEVVDLGEWFVREHGRVLVTVSDPIGAPLAGARVRLLTVDARLIGGAREQHTDLGGRALFDSVPAGTFDVVASAPDHATALLEELTVASRQSTLVELSLAAELTIRGVAVRRDTGAAPRAGVASALRLASSEKGAPTLVEPAPVDPATGAFTLRGLPAGLYKINVRAPGLGRATLRDVPAGAEGVRLTLIPQGGLDIQVVDPEGRAADSFTVLLRPDQPVLRAFGLAAPDRPWFATQLGPGAGGRAWISPLPRGRWQVMANAEEHGPSTAVVATVADGRIESVPLLWLTKARSLDGRVVDAADGSPLSAAEVSVAFLDTDTPLHDARQWTDSAGHFAFTALPSVELAVRATRHGWVPSGAVAPAEAHTLQIALERAGSLQVSITPEFALRQRGPFEVLLMSDEDNVRVLQDDVATTTTFVGLPAGGYELFLTPTWWLVEDAPSSTDPDEDPELQRLVTILSGTPTHVTFR